VQAISSAFPRRVGAPLENGEIRAVGIDCPQQRVDVRVIAATSRQSGNESIRFATRVLDGFWESHAAGWPGADVSSCPGQTRGGHRAYQAPTVRAHSPQVPRSKAVRRHSDLDVQLVRSLLISAVRAIRVVGIFKEFADQCWRHCRASARAVPVQLNRPAHGEQK
jgi:hypothetical protein